MGQVESVSIAEELIDRMKRGAAPADVAALFGDKLEMEIAGDVRAFPWIGRQIGRPAFEQFLSDAAALLERISFDVKDIVAGENKAVILGTLVSKVKKTRGTIETGFAMVLTIEDGCIIQFQMLEDSFAASIAAHFGDNPEPCSARPCKTGSTMMRIAGRGAS